MLAPSVSANCATIRSCTSNTCSSAPSAFASASATPVCGIDDAGGDAKAIAGALEAADDGQIEVQLGRAAPTVRARAADRFDDAHTIDDPRGARGAKIVRDGLGNA